MYEEEDDLLNELEGDKASSVNEEPSRPPAASRLITLDDEEDEGDIGKIKSMYEPKLELDFETLDKIQAVKTKPSLPLERMRSQKILIPGSVPEDDNDFSCLRWNAFGHVFSRTIESDNNLEIAFRDASIHEEIVMENNANRYIFADLNNNLLALASKKNDKGVSELYVRHIGSWDRDCALWTITMQNDERITSVAVGSDFVVISSDLRNIRVYTATGIFRFVFTIEGPIRSLVAGSNYFAIIRATGGLVVADTGDECEHRYCADVYKASVLTTCPVVKEKTVPLAVTPGSEITWASVTSNGHLCTMDDVFIVRYLTPNGLWIPVFNGADVLKAAERDSIWPISLTEKPTPTFRYLYCKGRSTPNFNRVEVPLSESWRLPIETNTNEKSTLEHELVMNELLLSLSKSQPGGEVSNDLNALLQEHSKTLVKFFALCCKKERDTRAFELAHMSTNTQNLQLMCNYAAKQKHVLLSNKITTLGQERSEDLYSRPAHSEQTSASYPSRTVSVQSSQKRIQLQKRKVVSSLEISSQSEMVEDSLLSNFNRPLSYSMNDTVGSLVNVTPSDSQLGTKENTPVNRKRVLESDSSQKSAAKQRKDGNGDFFDSLI
ncbi:Mcl1-mid domain-containing protein [Aphelenchoides besseyi]|nr:Mcl1-mid domain-containing protein [Aphelenchoides besseyi]